MALTTYAELKAAIEGWSDATDVSAYLDDFITLATDALTHGTDGVPALRIRDMETVTSLTPTSGSCTLPADYLQYRRVVEVASSRRDLEYITPITADVMYPAGNAGMSSNFTIVGNSLKVYPISTNTIELTYYASITPLSATNTTSWLLTKYPNIVLHACLMQLGLFRRDDDLVQRSGQIVASLVNGLNVENQMANYAKAGTRPRGMVVA